MTTSGSNLQQVQHAASDPNDALPSKRVVQPPPLDQSSELVQVFAAPPPLLKQRSAVKRSYTSLIAMSPQDSLLPPRSDAGKPEESVVQKVTPSPVVDVTVDDSKAVADLCQALNEDQAVLVSNPDAPSLTRSTMFTERSVTAKDIINAIDDFWALKQLPSMEIFIE